MSDPGPVDATFPEKVGEGVLRDHDVDVVAQDLGVLDGEPADSREEGAATLLAAALEALNRAQGDYDLFDALVRHGARGLVWEMVAERVAAYAWQVLESWICSGAIHEKLSSRYLGIPDWPTGRQRLAGDQVYREEIIAHVVAAALEKLQQGLAAGTGWDPRKGRSLSSYFVEGCLIAFVSMFAKEHRWWTAHHSSADLYDEVIEAGVSGTTVLWGSELGTDPADIVTDRIVLLDCLAAMPETDRLVLWAHACGYTHAEIAHLMSVTSKAIERRLHRIRNATHLSVRNR
ncbi:sigma factor-like helix-turn-helix DNA-binding protein [Nocardia fusca]|uniref:sigma factor-like helix-turn-helix DNA-binding protein n=1 Tax=Nocardia fusca TaxID=941183 RepID=UPI0007A762B5|nr:sigma factor-like helix-turn-helix DNA-binding protein [Nocardia fusca]